jgi:hypothetical protein
MAVRPLVSLVVVFLVSVSACDASAADDTNDMAEWSEALRRGIVARPHTVIEFEAGAIILPNAPISAAQAGGNFPVTIGHGDATIQIGAHLSYRPTPLWQFGGMVLFAPDPTNDTEYGLGGSSGLARTHSRDYFFVGAEGRLIPVHYRMFEGWIGIQGGATIIADRFTTTDEGTYQAPVGYPTVTERTEGLSGGFQGGISYSFFENFVVGFTTRVDAWYLPSAPNCSAIGDCATLRTSAFVIEGGFLFGYRIPL